MSDEDKPEPPVAKIIGGMCVISSLVLLAAGQILFAGDEATLARTVLTVCAGGDMLLGCLVLSGVIPVRPPKK